MNKPIDALTGFTLGVELSSEMESLISEGIDFALVIMDIDNLLLVNRDFGHDAGDAIFRLIAKHITAVFPEPAVSSRMGDQFDVLIPRCSKEEAFLKAENVRKLIFEERTPFLSSGNKPLVQSVSIGISAFPDDGSRAADIIRKADSALMRAKKNGRNQVCLAREEKLLPKTSHYTQAQLEKLTLIAKKEEVGEAVLLREALDDLLRKYDE